MKEKCFACDRKLTSSKATVETTDGQKVFVGPDCRKKIQKAGREGYQPPKGGPRLHLHDDYERVYSEPLTGNEP